MTKPLFSTAIVSQIILVIMFLLILFLAILFFSASNYKLILNNGRIQINSVFYSTDISLEDVDIKNVKVINLNESNKKISIRTNGLSLPGMQIGWFRGDGNKYKLYVTDKTKVVVIPVKNKYEILFSSNDAEKIADGIKKYIIN